MFLFLKCSERHRNIVLAVSLLAVLIIIAVQFGKYSKSHKQDLRSKYTSLKGNFTSTFNSTEQVNNHDNIENPDSEITTSFHQPKKEKFTEIPEEPVLTLRP